MKPLAKSFTKKGFEHEQVQRQGDVAIYRRGAPHHRDAHYEVVIVQKHKERVIAGVEIPASEGYPYDEQWGAYGWTYLQMENATVKFNALVASAALRDEIPATLTPQTTIQTPPESKRLES